MFAWAGQVIWMPNYLRNGRGNWLTRDPMSCPKGAARTHLQWLIVAVQECGSGVTRFSKFLRGSRNRDIYMKYF